MPVSKSSGPVGSAVISSFFLQLAQRYPGAHPACSVRLAQQDPFARSASRRWLAGPLPNCCSTAKPCEVCAPSRSPATGLSGSLLPYSSPPPVCTFIDNYTQLFSPLCPYVDDLPGAPLRPTPACPEPRSTPIRVLPEPIAAAETPHADRA